MFPIDRIGHRSRHDVAAGLDRFHTLPVSAAYTQSSPLPTLKH